MFSDAEDAPKEHESVKSGSYDPKLDEVPEEKK